MKDTWKQYLASASCCVCLMLMSITESSIYLYVVLGICVFFIIRPEVVFSAYFISSLSGGYFSVGNLGASRLLSLLVILSLLLQREKMTKLTGKQFMLEFVIIAYCALSCALSVTGSMSPFLIIVQCLLVTFLFKQSIEIDTELLTNLIVLSSFIAILFLGWHMTQDSTIMFEERYTGAEGLNTNKFAMMCTQLGAVMIGAFIYMDNKPLKIVCLASFAVSVIIVVLSGSRSALIGLLAASLFSVLLAQGQGIRKAILPVTLIVIVGFVLVRYFASIDSPILDRFSVESVVDNGGTGRVGYAQRIFNEVILVHPLLGVGLGGDNIMALGIPKQAHNIIIDPISQLGLVGFIIFLCFIAPIVVNAYKLRRKTHYIIIPLALFVAGMFNGVGEVVFYEKFFWNAIALCGMIVTQHLVLSEKK